jgi:hypothetical protein
MKPELISLLSRAFDEHQGDLRDRLSPEEYERLRFAFAFHLSDWEDDLKKLSSLVESPESWTPEQTSSFLIGMLYHVIPHLKAAGRILLDGVGDGFEGDDIDRILAKAHSSEVSSAS